MDFFSYQNYGYDLMARTPLTKITSKWPLLRDFIKQAAEHEQLQCFVEKPAINLKPQQYHFNSSFEILRQADARHRDFGSFETIDCRNMCVYMSPDGRTVHTFSKELYCKHDIYFNTSKIIKPTDPWPVDFRLHFSYWELKVDGLNIFLFNNTEGKLVIGTFHPDGKSILFGKEFHFYEGVYGHHDLSHTPKNKLLYAGGGELLFLNRKQRKQPELEIYSINCLEQPKHVFKDLPVGKNLDDCIKMEGGKIYILNFAHLRVPTDLTIIDISNGSREVRPINGELLSVGALFLLDIHPLNYIVHGVFLTGPPKLQCGIKQKFPDCILESSLYFLRSGAKHKTKFFIDKNMLTFLHVEAHSSLSMATVFVARLDMITGKVTRTIVDWHRPMDETFKTHFQLTPEGTVHILDIKTIANKIVFKTTAIITGVPSLKQMCMMMLKDHCPDIFKQCNLLM